MLVETIKYKGLKIEVFNDDSSQSPREWDNLGTLCTWHHRYHIGDLQPKVGPEDYLSGLDDNFVVLPVYLYDHSGVSISTKPFSCSWDSGQVGFIYCSLAQAGDFFNSTKSWSSLVKWANEETITLRDAATKALTGEIEVYDQFLNNQVYGWVCEDESCFGYFGDDFESSGLLPAAREVADWIISLRKEKS